MVTGLSGSSSSFLISAIEELSSRPLLIITQRPEEAADLVDDLSFLLSDDTVGHFPARQILPYDFRAPQGEIIGKRIATITGLLDKKLKVVVCPMRALIEPTMSIPQLKSHRISISVNDEIDLEQLVNKLIEQGFKRVPVVEEVGDFALRGGLVDFFSPGSDAPVRIELFGDEVDTIRHFDVATQRTVERVETVNILPKREIPITHDTLEQHLNLLPEDDADYIRSRYLNDPELPGLEWLSILFGISQGHLSDYLPEKTIIWYEGEGVLHEEANAILAEGSSLYERLQGRLTKLPSPEQYYQDREKLYDLLNKYDSIDHVPFRGGRTDTIDFGCKPHPALGARLDLLVQTTTEWENNGYISFVATDSEAQARRMDELITERVGSNKKPRIEVADIKGGFVCPDGRFAILTDHEIFHRHHRRVRKKKFKEGIAISDYSSLNAGDYVVHTEHGIALYLGLKTIEVDQRNRDCLLLQYDENARVYIPIEEFNRVSKFSGKDGTPTLTRLGTPNWEKLKKKAKKAVEDMASELLELYARRKAQKGTSFGDDTVWMKQLEASFPYEETRDQLKAIYDVKKDMKEARPMDRLVCGDVGFGKTEVAVRAAFKAIEAGTQVAILVPTTILAQQHFQTFSERLADFPMKVEMLSRFRSRKEQLAIIDDLATGKLDLVVGTHRLLSKDITFKNLGLLIIDEEHRFGVRNKEKLRQMKVEVDTIAMTATPIPRTLQLSLSGVRDMSLITTSPKDRLPILTEIVEFDEAVVATAILREIDRGGQVFYVHNRVQTIDSMYRHLKKLVPQAEIAVAHGQMPEKSLEGLMMAFMAKRYNVLLCTTIIESGLDIPNANTIIIHRADRFGLAQLYQLRGRVGRSATRAYAYLLTPPMKSLRKDAIKRLRALEAHSDLGSGFALAMRDLEIRGAGAVLGSKQSGFIEEIGFDMYNKLLEEAIAKMKGEEVQQLPETKMEMDIETYLSDDYVTDRQQKVDLYRRLSDSRTLDDVEKLRDEMIDRFGRPPQSAMNLFDAGAVRILSASFGLERLKLKNSVCKLYLDENKQLTRGHVEAFHSSTTQPIEFSILERSQITIDLNSLDERDHLPHLRQILDKVRSVG